MVQSSVNNLSSFRNYLPQVLGPTNPEPIQPNQDNKIREALQAIQGLDLRIEICGSWVWVFGANGSHEAKLRVANFNWSYKKGCWYYCPKYAKPNIRRRPLAMEKIRERYGSQVVSL